MITLLRKYSHLYTFFIYNFQDLYLFIKINGIRFVLYSFYCCYY